MKKLFKIKIELIQLIVTFVSTILIWNINDMYRDDAKVMVLAFILFGSCIFSIIAYKPIKEFRKEVLRRW